MKVCIIATILLALFPGHALHGEVKEHPVPRVVENDGRYALFVDGAPYLILGAQSNNSSDWPATLPKVWSAIEYLHANTLETPIYWEQFEPKPGQFDYSQVDIVLAQAREHHVHLVLLWFGTWKNGSQHYMPEWMKLDSQRYFHVMNKNGEYIDSPSPFATASMEADKRANILSVLVHHVEVEYIDSPSPFATASMEADKRAFGALMRHLKQADSERTVLMVQVEIGRASCRGR